VAADQTFTFSGSGVSGDTPEGFQIQTPAGNSGGVFVLSGDDPISNVGIGSSPISESVQVLASVEDFRINLNDGNDRLLIGGDATRATIELGTGRDSLVIEGNLVDSGVDLGAGPDAMRVDGDVINSYINTGNDVDQLGILGDVSGSNIQLGTGNDQIRFFGDATDTLLNLGGGKDIVRFLDSDPDTTGLVIEGASSDDMLFIGSSQYKFVGDYTWQNVADPTDTERFGPPV
jgi:hypothetical protein